VLYGRKLFLSSEDKGVFVDICELTTQKTVCETKGNEKKDLKESRNAFTV